MALPHTPSDGAGLDWANLPGPAWAAVLAHVCRGCHGRLYMRDCAAMAGTCKAFGEALRAHQPAVFYDLRGHPARDSGLSKAEACGQHFARLGAAPLFRVHVQTTPHSAELCAFLRVGGWEPRPAVGTVVLDGVLDAGKAVLLGRVFSGLQELHSGDGRGNALAAGSEAVEALRGIGAICPGLRALEVAVVRMGDLAGVSACTALRRLRAVHYTDEDSGDDGVDGGFDGSPDMLHPLSGLTTLEALEIHISDHPSPDQLRPLTGLTRLTSLTCIDGCLNGDSLAALGQLPALARLGTEELWAMETVAWQLPRLTRLTCRGFGRLGPVQGGLPALGRIVTQRCTALRSLTVDALFDVAEDESDDGGLRRCVRALHTLEARGLLAGVRLCLRCSPAGLQAAWLAELGEEALVRGLERLAVGPGPYVSEPEGSAAWPWLFGHMPGVRVLLCPDGAAYAAVAHLQKLRLLCVPVNAHRRASLQVRLRAMRMAAAARSIERDARTQGRQLHVRVGPDYEMRRLFDGPA